MRWLVVWVAMWLVVVGNLPLWQRVADQGGEGLARIVLFVGLGLLVLGGTVALLSVLAWSRVARVATSALLLVTAFNAYFMWQYGAVIDSTMLGNVLQTDAREIRDLLSFSLAVTVLLIAGPPLWWLWRLPLQPRVFWSRLGRNAVGVLTGLSLAVVAALMSYQGLASLMRNDKSLRYMINPLNSVYAAARLGAEQIPQQMQPLQPTGLDARLGSQYNGQARPPLLMLVVGETARAQNFGLSGYARQTTPALQRWQDQGGLVNFTQVQSCGTNTQVSVPCMFSPLTREQGGHQPPRQENLLDVLHRAGLAVLWLDNQSGCKGVCARVPHVMTGHLNLPGHCDGGECFDTVMLAGLDERMAALDPERRARGVVLVLHQMGSHGPAYFKRSPADRKPFMPECTSVTLSSCSPEQLVNAYDNSVAFTDHFLDQGLGWLQRQADSGGFDTALFYLSDHGESLGEKGLYLHGVPYALAPKEQTHVPMLTWLSRGYQQRTGLRLDCLRQRSAQPLTHDHLFHTVLSLMDVQTQAYLPHLDALAPCLPDRRGAAVNG
jgi:lipid A ethanolaminephosphotransferase